MGTRARLILFSLLISWSVWSQTPTGTPVSDTLQKVRKDNPFNTGYYPIWFFDVDLRYLIKYNNYEGFRLGFGGITNNRLFEDFKIGGYIARGFKDEEYKYSLGGNVRLRSESNTWLQLYYQNDIKEIGAFNYLTDARVYSVFEPRLINITQFYSYRTWRSGIQHEFSKKFLSELRLSHTKIDQIENYLFVTPENTFKNYYLAEATFGFRISPKTNFLTTEDGMIEYFDGLPKISGQITQGIKGLIRSDFSYTKVGLKLDYYVKRTDLSSTHFVLEGNHAFGDVPLTHLFHAYPNSPTNDAILQRFSVAGIRSFETMYFGEFFSDRLATLQVKHSLRRFYFSEKFQPELVLITRHALGDLRDLDRHQGISFSTLDQLYSETGLELNRILFGFGLSAAYRYGYYHLPEFDDNISFKFTFNLKI